MKHRNIVVIIFVMGSSMAALAQTTTTGVDCAAWAKVKSWVGTYTMTGNGSGSPGDGTATFSHQGQGTFTLNNFSGSCPGLLQWMGQTTTSSGSIDDVWALPPTTNCSSPSISVNGSAAGAGQGKLVVDTSNSTYRLSDFQEQISGVETLQCGNQVIPGGNGDAWPVDGSIAPCLGFAGPNYALPSTPQILQQAPPGKKLTGEVLNSATGCSVSIPWILTFKLTPVLNDNQDDPCKKKGGSSVACQNQSLGEDVPVVGTPFFLHYEGERASGTSGSNSVANKDARMIGGWTLNVHHTYDPNTDTLFLGDGAQRSAWQFSKPITLNGNYLITSQDGGEIYVFSASGRHLQTLQPMTGALKYQFAYDASGNLISVTDAVGNVTTIHRNVSEQATSIVSPFLQTTNLVSSNGFLSEVVDPAGHTVKFTYTATGLITARTDANGHVYTYTYDSSGKLIKDADPAGGFLSLSRTNSTSNYAVTTTTALGRKSSYEVMNTAAPGEQMTNTWPNGLQASFTKTQQSNQLSEITKLPDGSLDSSKSGPDPRWGIQAPVLSSATLTRGNLNMSKTFTRTVAVSTPGNPFSLTSQLDKETINGRLYQTSYAASTKAFTHTTPVGRKLVATLDSKERLASIQPGNLLPTTFTYDSRGHITTITQGARITTLAYGADGFLASITDPMGLKSSFARDADGRPLSTTLADGRVIHYSNDANGNMLSTTPPGTSAHDFTYTPVDLLSEYLPPTATLTGPTNYTYDADREITRVTRPDGKTILFGYDGAGRLQTLTTSTSTITYSYFSTTGNLASAAISGESLTYGYNGPLPTSSTWAGNIAGSVGRAYNNNFWVTSQTINGANTVAFTYDNDGLVTQAGALAISHSATNGLISGTTVGSATDSRTYNSFGELAGYTASANGIGVYTVTYTRDNDGRISSKTETIGGKATTYAYTYDLAGRLTGVSKNGIPVSSYVYDSNSNRVKAVTSSGTVSATYDAQDRLITYGPAAYTYNPNGELASQTVGTQKTTYQYDVLGNLLGVTLPGGKAISYLVDAENRRVGKKVNGTLIEGFLYDGPRIVAQLNASNALVSQFIYASRANSPDYMVRGGVTYRIFSDQLGSPRFVVNTTTGAIAEQITYDEFGNVISDTNPGFHPFGFAGGLYDPDTKLLRFGARDYNPSTGRWTAKDPILFTAGNSNLYAYVVNDPVNLVDPAGMDSSPEEASLYFGATYSGLVSMFYSVSQPSTADLARAFQAAMESTPGWGAGAVEAGDLAAGVADVSLLGENLAVLGAAVGGWIQGTMIDQILIEANHGRSFGDELYGINQEAARFGHELWKYLKRKIASPCANGRGTGNGPPNVGHYI